jgi:hypothetical protein
MCLMKCINVGIATLFLNLFDNLIGFMIFNTSIMLLKLHFVIIDLVCYENFFNSGRYHECTGWYCEKIVNYFEGVSSAKIKSKFHIILKNKQILFYISYLLEFAWLEQSMISYDYFLDRMYH